MQLEQQESFEIKGPQLEVFGEAETRLPAAAKKRPAALAVLAVAIVASVLGIGGAQLKGQWRETSEIYTSQIDDYGNGIQPERRISKPCTVRDRGKSASEQQKRHARGLLSIP